MGTTFVYENGQLMSANGRIFCYFVKHACKEITAKWLRHHCPFPILAADISLVIQEKEAVVDFVFLQIFIFKKSYAILSYRLPVMLAIYQESICLWLSAVFCKSLYAFCLY